jgi:hypothetical protein
MNKLIFAVSLLLTTTNLFAEGDPLTITKKNRGLFGYKSVNETIGEGQHTLTCLDPGRTACRTNGMAVVFDETLTLTADELATVDSQVDNFVNVERNENGKFVFSNKAVIVYSYNPDTDALVYTIYSVKQATDLHVI